MSNNNLTSEEFQEWANHPVTLAVRNELIEQAEHYNGFDFSLVDQVAINSAQVTLEALGLDSAMRVSMVRGIELFTDFDNLHEQMMEADDEDN